MRSQLPMLAREDVPVESLVRVTDVQLINENIVGTAVPLVEHIEIELTHTAIWPTHWVDFLVELLQQMVRLRIELQVRQLRYRQLDKATRDNITAGQSVLKGSDPQTRRISRKYRYTCLIRTGPVL